MIVTKDGFRVDSARDRSKADFRIELELKNRAQATNST